MNFSSAALRRSSLASRGSIPVSHRACKRRASLRALFSELSAGPSRRHTFTLPIVIRNDLPWTLLWNMNALSPVAVIRKPRPGTSLSQ